MSYQVIAVLYVVGCAAFLVLKGKQLTHEVYTGGIVSIGIALMIATGGEPSRLKEWFAGSHTTQEADLFQQQNEVNKDFAAEMEKASKVNRDKKAAGDFDQLLSETSR